MKTPKFDRTTSPIIWKKNGNIGLERNWLGDNAEFSIKQKFITHEDIKARKDNRPFRGYMGKYWLESISFLGWYHPEDDNSLLFYSLPVKKSDKHHERYRSTIAGELRNKKGELIEKGIVRVVCSGHPNLPTNSIGFSVGSILSENHVKVFNNTEILDINKQISLVSKQTMIVQRAELRIYLIIDPPTPDNITEDDIVDWDNSYLHVQLIELQNLKNQS